MNRTTKLNSLEKLSVILNVEEKQILNIINNKRARNKNLNMKNIILNVNQYIKYVDEILEYKDKEIENLKTDLYFSTIYKDQ